MILAFHHFDVLPSVRLDSERGFVTPERYLAVADDLRVLASGQFTKSLSDGAKRYEVLADAQSHRFEFIRTARVDDEGFLARVYLALDLGRADALETALELVLHDVGSRDVVVHGKRERRAYGRSALMRSSTVMFPWIASAH